MDSCVLAPPPGRLFIIFIFLFDHVLNALFISYINTLSNIRVSRLISDRFCDHVLISLTRNTLRRCLLADDHAKFTEIFPGNTEITPEEMFTLEYVHFKKINGKHRMSLTLYAYHLIIISS